MMRAPLGSSDPNQIIQNQFLRTLQDGVPVDVSMQYGFLKYISNSLTYLFKIGQLNGEYSMSGVTGITLRS